MAQPLLVPAKHKAHRLPMRITESFDYAIVGDAVVGQGTQQPTIFDPLHAIQHRFQSFTLRTIEQTSEMHILSRIRSFGLPDAHRML